MKHQNYLMLLAPCLILHGCGMFQGSSVCNHPEVKDSVKKLYATQVNLKPSSTLTPTQQNKLIETQSAQGIELEEIREIDLNSVKTSEAKSDADVLKNSMIERFHGAQIVCEGIIYQHIQPEKIKQLQSQVIKQQSITILKNNQLHIPVFYAVYPSKNNTNYTVQYTTKNPLELMQAIWILQSSTSEQN